MRSLSVSIKRKSTDGLLRISFVGRRWCVDVAVPAGRDSVLTQGHPPYGHSSTCVTVAVDTDLLTGHPPHAGRGMEFTPLVKARMAMGWSIPRTGSRL